MSAIYTAVAHNPDTKLKYLEIEWKDRPDWIVVVKTKCQELWAYEYRSLPFVDTIVVEASPVSGSLVIPEVN